MLPRDALISEADRSKLGEVMRAQYITPEWRRVADALAAEMDAGRLRRAEPFRAAMHLMGLIETDLIQRRLHGELGLPQRAMETEVKAGVDAFLRAYAP